MKISNITRIILFWGMIYVLGSCAEEGPFESGKLDGKFSTILVTPTEAIIGVEIPNNSLLDGIREVYLNDAYVNASYDMLKNGNQIMFYFGNLDSNTTYYPIFYLRGTFNGKFKYIYPFYNEFLYNPGFSFTTPREGNFSALSEFQAKVIKYPKKNGYYDDKTTKVRVTLPPDIYFTGGSLLEASESQNMTEVISGYNAQKIDDCTCDFQFDYLHTTTYYLRLSGQFIYRGFTIGTYNDIIINAANTITVQYQEDIQ